MSWVDSSLCNAVFLIVAFALAAQKTAAQAVLCGQYQNLTSTSGQYTISNNLWGEDKSGSQCTTVEDEQDGTAFSTTWNWKAVSNYASQTKVHSYANVKSRSDTLPIMLSNITALEVSATWAMYPSGTGKSNTLDVTGLNAMGVKADVTLDFFLDPDFDQSTNVTNPKYEVMVWLASLGSTQPLGFADGSIGSTVLGGNNFSLYAGENNQDAAISDSPGQAVFSFVAPENMTSFSQLDIFPLFEYLLAYRRMSRSTYLGTAQFGSEAFHSNGNNVTFEASNIDMTVLTTPTKGNAAPTKTGSPTTKSGAAPGKSSAVSLKGYWILLGGTMGAWMLL